MNMNKTNIRRIWYIIRHDYATLNNVVITVALIIAASWAWGSIQMMQRNYALQNVIDDKQREKAVISLEVDTLGYEQRYLQSDEYLELAARDRLGLAKRGEHLLLLPENSSEPEQSSTASARSPRASNVEQWLNFLFGGNAKRLQE